MQMEEYYKLACDPLAILAGHFRQGQVSTIISRNSPSAFVIDLQVGFQLSRLQGCIFNDLGGCTTSFFLLSYSRGRECNNKIYKLQSMCFPEDTLFDSQKKRNISVLKDNFL